VFLFRLVQYDIGLGDFEDSVPEQYNLPVRTGHHLEARGRQIAERALL